MSTFKDLSYEQRVALLQRLQSGVPIWRSRQTGPRAKRLLVNGDKNPQGKAAQRRRKQLERQGKIMIGEHTYKVIPHGVKGVAPLPERAVVTGIASPVASNPGEMDTPGIQGTLDNEKAHSDRSRE